MIDFEQKLMVVVLHGYEIYLWSQVNPHEKGMGVQHMYTIA